MQWRKWENWREWHEAMNWRGEKGENCKRLIWRGCARAGGRCRRGGLTVEGVSEEEEEGLNAWKRVCEVWDRCRGRFCGRLKLSRGES